MKKIILVLLFLLSSHIFALQVANRQQVRMTIASGDSVGTATLSGFTSTAQMVPIFATWQVADGQSPCLASNTEVDFEVTATDELKAHRWGNPAYAISITVNVLEFGADTDIQTGTFAMTNAETEDSVTIDALTLAETFTIHYRVNEGEASPSNDSDPDGRLTGSWFRSTTQINFERSVATGAINGHWWTISSPTATVQHVNYTPGSIATTEFKNNFTAVALAESFTVCSYWCNSYTYNGEAIVTTNLTDVDTVTWRRWYGAGILFGMHYQIISDTAITVERGTAEPNTVADTFQVTTIDSNYSIVKSGSGKAGTTNNNNYLNGTLQSRYLEIFFVSEDSIAFQTGQLNSTDEQTWEIITFDVAVPAVPGTFYVDTSFNTGCTLNFLDGQDSIYELNDSINIELVVDAGYVANWNNRNDVGTLDAATRDTLRSVATENLNIVATARVWPTFIIDSTLIDGNTVIFDIYGTVDSSVTVNVDITLPVDTICTLSGDTSGYLLAFSDVVDENKSYTFTFGDIPTGIICTSTGETFNPIITATGDYTAFWQYADDSVTIGVECDKDYGSASSRINTLVVTPWSAVKKLNFGYSAVDGGGGYNPAGDIHIAQNISQIQNINLVSDSLYKFYALTSEITSLDFTSFGYLDAIEVYQGSLTSIDLTGCSALRRICVETCALTSFDVSDCIAMEDMRGAGNNFTSINFASQHPALWHLCIQSGPVETLPPIGATFPAMIQLWTWNCNISGDIGISSENTELSSAYIYGNNYTCNELDDAVDSLLVIGNTTGVINVTNSADELTDEGKDSILALQTLGWTVTYTDAGEYHYLTTTAGTGGTVTPSTCVSAPQEIVASPAGGYAFSYYEITSGNLTWNPDSLTATTTVTASDNAVINAVFVESVDPDSSTLTVNTPANGTINIDPDILRRESGDQSTITAVASDNYHFVTWLEDVADSSSNPITYNWDATNRTVDATFGIDTFYVDTSFNTGCTLNFLDGQDSIYELNDSINIELVVDAGYVANWNNRNDVGTLDAATRDTLRSVATENLNIVATARVWPTFTLTVNITGTGVVDTLPSAGYLDSTRVDTLVATPGVDSVATFSGDFDTQSGDSVFFTMDENKTIGITFSEAGQPPTITTQPVEQHKKVGENIDFYIECSSEYTNTFQWYSDSGNGVSNISNAVTGETDSTLTYVATLGNDGWFYVCEAINENGTTRSDSATVEIWPTYAIDTTIVGSGTCTIIEGVTGIDSGEVVHLSSVPAQYFKFDAYSVGFVSSDAVDSFTIVDNVSITITFAAYPTYTITEVAATNGDIQYSVGPAGIDSSANVVITAIADAGYSFTGWGSDTTGTTNPFTWVSIDENKSLSASFSLLPTIISAENWRTLTPLSVKYALVGDTMTFSGSDIGDSTGNSELWLNSTGTVLVTDIVRWDGTNDTIAFIVPSTVRGGYKPRVTNGENGLVSAAKDTTDIQVLIPGSN